VAPNATQQQEKLKALDKHTNAHQRTNPHWMHHKKNWHNVPNLA
jgi:hypothetical protein